MTYSIILILLCSAQNASPDVIKVLAGNKCDNDSLRAVDKADGEKVSIIIEQCYIILHTYSSSSLFRLTRDYNIVGIPGMIII